MHELLFPCATRAAKFLCKQKEMRSSHTGTFLLHNGQTTVGLGFTALDPPLRIPRSIPSAAGPSSVVFLRPPTRPNSTPGYHPLTGRMLPRRVDARTECQHGAWLTPASRMRPLGPFNPLPPPPQTTAPPYSANNALPRRHWGTLEQPGTSKRSIFSLQGLDIEYGVPGNSWPPRERMRARVRGAIRRLLRNAAMPSAVLCRPECVNGAVLIAPRISRWGGVGVISFSPFFEKIPYT